MPTGVGSAATLPGAPARRPLRVALVLAAFTAAGAGGYAWQRLSRPEPIAYIESERNPSATKIAPSTTTCRAAEPSPRCTNCGKSATKKPAVRNTSAT